MTSQVVTPSAVKRISSRKLIMEPCPQCNVSTAFEFDSDSSYSISCLNCGYVKNLDVQFLKWNKQCEQWE